MHATLVCMLQFLYYSVLFLLLSAYILELFKFNIGSNENIETKITKLIKVFIPPKINTVFIFSDIQPITIPIPSLGPSVIITALPPSNTTLPERTTPSPNPVSPTVATSPDINCDLTSKVINPWYISSTTKDVRPVSSSTTTSSTTSVTTERTTSTSTSPSTTTTTSTTRKSTTVKPYKKTTNSSSTKTVTAKEKSTTKLFTQPETSTSTNTLPVPNEITSAKRKKAFLSYLTVLFVSLGIAFSVVLLVFIYKKCGDLKQSRLSDDSDVKYLQQGDEDYHGMDDSDSMIYHPKWSCESIHNSNISGPESSASTSVASSIGSSGSDSSSSKKPVRPPPPVPNKSTKQTESLVSCATPTGHSWQNEPQLINIDLSEEEGSVASANSWTNILDSTNQSRPPPIPPRTFGGSTSV